jgi:single-strand DNA-binding protein
MNSVILLGRLTANPTSHAGEKHQSCTCRLAVPLSGTDSTDLIDIVTLDKLAATCADWLSEGREVAVVGKLRRCTVTERSGSKRRRRVD